LHGLRVIEEESLTPLQSIRLLALLNVAMNDGFIVCWQVKYKWWVLRPITAAHERGNADFRPALHTPPHPSYVSGHSVISFAAAEVLAEMLPKRADDFRGMAKEAATSRIYGGIHYPMDSEQGKELGQRVGGRVLEAIIH